MDAAQGVRYFIGRFNGLDERKRLRKHFSIVSDDFKYQTPQSHAPVSEVLCTRGAEVGGAASVLPSRKLDYEALVIHADNFGHGCCATRTPRDDDGI